VTHPGGSLSSGQSRSLRQYAGLFAVLAVLGGLGFVLAGIYALADYQASGSAWVYFVLAVAVILQCGWFYAISKAVAELLDRTTPQGGPVTASPAPDPAPQLETLIGLLGAPTAKYREQAVEELGNRGAAAAKALPQIEALFADPDSSVRTRAKWAAEAIRKAVEQ
jgi:hypothetical protein